MRKRLAKLLKSNTHLKQFLQQPLPSDIVLWSFKDKHGRVVMVEFSNGKPESDYWKKSVDKTLSKRACFYKMYPELLPT